MDPKSNGYVLIREKRRRVHKRDIGEKQCEDGSRYWSYVATRQGMPRIANCHQNGMNSLSGPPGGTNPLNT